MDSSGLTLHQFVTLHVVHHSGTHQPCLDKYAATHVSTGSQECKSHTEPERNRRKKHCGEVPNHGWRLGEQRHTEEHQGESVATPTATTCNNGRPHHANQTKAARLVRLSVEEWKQEKRRGSICRLTAGEAMLDLRGLACGRSSTEYTVQVRLFTALWFECRSGCGH